MPRRCIIAGCNTEGKQGRSLHHFPKNEATRAKWVKAVHGQRLNWNGNIDGSLICSMHFEPECFDTESRNRKKMGLPAKRPCLNTGPFQLFFPSLRAQKVVVAIANHRIYLADQLQNEDSEKQ